MKNTQLTIHPDSRQGFSGGLGGENESLLASYPEGIAAHSRWSSSATPPESLRGPHWLESLRDTEDDLSLQSGGIASLNHRRLASTPAGWDRGTTDILVRRTRDGQECPSYGLFWIVAASFIFAMVSSAIAAEPTPPPVSEAEPAEAASDPAPAQTSPPKDSPLPQPEAPGADVPTPGAEALAEEPSDAEVLLDEALAAMDRAVQELDGDEPTPEAVHSQQLAVDRLKDLLAAASQSSSSHNSSSKNKNSSSSQEPSDPKNEQPAESSSSDPTGSGGRRADDQNSAESSENVEGPTLPGSGVLAPGARANSFWGHLPAREREALFRSLSDSFLPEYEAQIRRYYEAIAEKK